MSSATSPYQSRLLSWLNRQSIRLRDRFAKTIRRVKITAIWSIQILLYPIYLGVQTGRIAARGLGEKVKSSILLKLSPTPQSDQPLEKVFDLIQPWLDVPPLTVDLATNQTQTTIDTLPVDSFARRPQLRGIACLIETQHLVLVDRQNQTWDIISSRQQQQLKQRIFNELVKYWQKQRLIYQSQQPWLKPLPLISVNPHVLPPIIWFWQLMAWIQTREVALAINLFGESHWVCPVTYIAVPLPPEEEDIRLAFSTEEVKLKTDFNANQRRLIDSADDYAFTNEYVQSNNSIQSLIQAAVDYFFGSKTSLSGYDSDYTVNTQVVTSDRQFDQRPVKTKNLVGRVRNRLSAKPSRRQASDPLPNLLSPSATNQKPNKRKYQFQTDKTFQSLPPKKGKSKQSFRSVTNPLKKLDRSRLKSLPQTQTQADLQLQSKLAPEASPNHIETAATPQGYHQNLLEKIIAWLDRLFFKIEKAIMTIWRKFKR